MEIYVTKWALTRGVFRVEAEPAPGDGHTMCFRLVYDEMGSVFSLPMYAHAGEWFTDEEAALARAEAMRQREIRRLQEELRVIRTMEIEVVHAKMARFDGHSQAQVRDELLNA
ncbi:MAG: hypothetical protein ACLFRJ_10350 [Ectothiorhodospira sp.]